MDGDKLTKETYDSISKVYADTNTGYAERIDFFLGLVKKSGKILDAGCGPGIDAAYMVSRGFETVGVDVSQGMLEIARKTSPKTLFVEEDIRRLQFKAGSFDAIIASFSIIHLPKADVPKVVGNFYRMLKSGGVLYLGVQEGESRESIYETPLDNGRKIFLNIISALELQQILTNAGFKILSEFSRPPKERELNFNKLIVIAKK